ncbi:MAG: LapA family protein [Alphaproteobacteria bacterium]|nr:LapA family protein [Alphaproteobacteria bacterium]
MRIFSGVFGIVLLVLVMFFAMSNKQDVSVALWFFDETLLVPLYAVALVPLFVGLFLGWLWAWIRAIPDRLYARQISKELAALNGRIGELQKNGIPQASQAKRSFWKWL